MRIPAPSTMSSAFNVPSWGSGPWLLSQSRHHGKQSSTSSSYPLFSFCLVCGCFSCVRTRTSTTVHMLHLCAVYISYANPSCVVFFGRSMPQCCCRCHRTMQLTLERGAVCWGGLQFYLVQSSARWVASGCTHHLLMLDLMGPVP